MVMLFMVQRQKAAVEFQRLAVLLQLGLATFRGSLTPVSGSLNSFQLMGTMSFPMSLIAIITPRSLDAVER
jgi:hypothetical protein